MFDECMQVVYSTQLLGILSCVCILFDVCWGGVMLFVVGYVYVVFG